MTTFISISASLCHLALLELSIQSCLLSRPLQYQHTCIDTYHATNRCKMFRSPEQNFVELLDDSDYPWPNSFHTLVDNTYPASTHARPMPAVGRSSWPTVPRSSLRPGSRQSLDSGYEEPKMFRQAYNNIDDGDFILSHGNSTASSSTTTGAGSPELQYSLDNTAHIFDASASPAATLWLAGADTPLTQTLEASATTMNQNAFLAHRFGAQMSSPFSYQAYQQDWSQDTTSSHKLDSGMNWSWLDPIPQLSALPARPAHAAHNSRAYSEMTPPAAALTPRNSTLLAEGSISKSEEFSSITRTTPPGITKPVARTKRRQTMPAITTTPKTTASTRRRASTRVGGRPAAMLNKYASSGGSRSKTGSGPSSPEVNRSQGQRARGNFTCPLSPYGCDAEFTTKNEWKRHVITKHLKLGEYECSLCPEEGMRPPYQNPRKDLFSQHIWRIHLQAGESTVSPQPAAQCATIGSACKKSRAHTRQCCTSSSGQVTEAILAKYGDIYPSCWKSMRATPQEAYCVFCGEHFQGDSSVESWLEHVGRQHLATLQPRRRGEHTTGHNTNSAAMPNYTHSVWLNDTGLQAWLLHYGEIVWDNAASSYALAGDSHPASTTIVAEQSQSPDAEGELNFDFDVSDFM